MISKKYSADEIVGNGKFFFQKIKIKIKMKEWKIQIKISPKYYV